MLSIGTLENLHGILMENHIIQQENMNLENAKHSHWHFNEHFFI